MNKLHIKQTVIVEGKCDRTVLENVIDTTIIPVNGFGIYKDKEKLALIRRYAACPEAGGVIILTDSDNAGRQIRNYLKDCLRGFEVHHLYVPNLYQVEDTRTELLRNVFAQHVGANCVRPSYHFRPSDKITRERLFDDGLIGGNNSARKRKKLLSAMQLPENLSVTALLDVLNKCGSDDYERIIKNL